LGSTPIRSSDSWLRTGRTIIEPGAGSRVRSYTVESANEIRCQVAVAGETWTKVKRLYRD